jgi:hypothetical protein
MATRIEVDGKTAWLDDALEWHHPDLNFEEALNAATRAWFPDAASPSNPNPWAIIAEAMADAFGGRETLVLGHPESLRTGIISGTMG